MRVVRACVCGSDLHPYHNMPATPGGSPMGHEFVGVVEETGREVSTLKKGDFVIAPFAWSDGTCDFCREGLQTSCRHGGFWAGNGIDRTPSRRSSSSRLESRTTRAAVRCLRHRELRRLHWPEQASAAGPQ